MTQIVSQLLTLVGKGQSFYRARHQWNNLTPTCRHYEDTMPDMKRDGAHGPRRSRRALSLTGIRPPVAPPTAAAALEESRRAGLLDDEKTVDVRFRAPRALVEEALLQSRAATLEDLGQLALAVLAQPDPVVAFLRQTRGALGEDHDLED